ncbi:hypothetical protein NicSoilB8_36320 [Arthrobacter sp. NicSoilB8]|nr:hypothetical protein NicSoilB8_36320 [Arthrobacter sp. NicSoilB8]
MADVQHQAESFFQVVRPFDHHIQGLEALGRHMALGRYFRLTAIEVKPDKNPEFVVQNDSPVRACTAWPRRCDRVGRDAATDLSLGRECDVGNTSLHIRETSRYLPLYWPASVDCRARCTVLEAATAPARHLALAQIDSGHGARPTQRNT